MSVLFLALAAAADPAPAPRAQATAPLEAVQAALPERVELPVAMPCDKSEESDTEVVVCGRGTAERYRIDPTTLSAIRSREKKYTDQALGRSKLFKETCNPVGLAAGGLDQRHVAGVQRTHRRHQRDALARCAERGDRFSEGFQLTDGLHALALSI